MKKRRLILSIWSVLVMLAMLTACTGNTASGGDKTNSASGNDVTVNIGVPSDPGSGTVNTNSDQSSNSEISTENNNNDVTEDTTDETPSEVFLLDVAKPYQDDDVYYFPEEEPVSMGGEIYNNGIIFSGLDSFVFINLRGEYKTLTYTQGHIDQTDLHDATVMIELDKKKLDPYTLSCEDMPDEYTVDVTGVKQLKIKVTIDGYSQYAFAEMKLTK